MNALHRYPVKHPPLSMARSRTGKFRGAWLLSKSRMAWGRKPGTRTATTETGTARRRRGRVRRRRRPMRQGARLAGTGGRERGGGAVTWPPNLDHRRRRIISTPEQRHTPGRREEGRELAPALQACQNSRRASTPGGRIGSSCRSRPPLVQEACDASMLGEGGDGQREETEMRGLSRQPTGMSKLTPREADAREWEGDHVRVGDDARTTSSPACPRRPELLLGRPTPATSPAHRRPTPLASPPPPWPD
jgi:hypothetical protein